MPVASTPPVFPELAAAIARTGQAYTTFGPRVGCGPVHLSSVIRGYKAPSPALRSRIATELGRPEAELFARARS